MRAGRGLSTKRLLFLDADPHAVTAPLLACVLMPGFSSQPSPRPARPPLIDPFSSAALLHRKDASLCDPLCIYHVSGCTKTPGCLLISLLTNFICYVIR